MDKDFNFGFHCNKKDISKFSEELEITAAQIFLGSPRSWKRPDNLTKNSINNKNNISIYVHSCYLINPCSANEDTRIKSIETLQKELDNAQLIGAAGVIVHAGQAGKEATMNEAIEYWKDTINELNFTTPLIIENTAGGVTAPGRYLKDYSKLLKDLKEINENIGYCIDTCHSWAGGMELKNLYEKLMEELEVKPDLIHLNGSKDKINSGRDHHSNLDLKDLQTQFSLEFVNKCKSPVIFETPGTNGLSDIKILKEKFNI